MLRLSDSWSRPSSSCGLHQLWCRCLRRVREIRCRRPSAAPVTRQSKSSPNPEPALRRVRGRARRGEPGKPECLNEGSGSADPRSRSKQLECADRSCRSTGPSGRHVTGSTEATTVRPTQPCIPWRWSARAATPGPASPPGAPSRACGTRARPRGRQCLGDVSAGDRPGALDRYVHPWSELTTTTVPPAP